MPGIPATLETYPTIVQSLSFPPTPRFVLQVGEYRRVCDRTTNRSGYGGPRRERVRPVRWSLEVPRFSEGGRRDLLQTAKATHPHGYLENVRFIEASKTRDCPCSSRCRSRHLHSRLPTRPSQKPDCILPTNWRRKQGYAELGRRSDTDLRRRLLNMHAALESVTVSVLTIMSSSPRI